MKLANAAGRAVIVTGQGRGLDVETVSAGRFGPSVEDILERWDDFLSVINNAISQNGQDAVVEFQPDELGCPSPAPRQIFAIGLNYRAHAAESGFAAPEYLPPTFTKFASSLSGPVTTVRLPPGGRSDWEVELVVIVGRTAHGVSRAEAWDHVAGVAVGQDLSERGVQLRGPAPQFGLGKSFPGFSPVGPWLVTPDELANRDDVAIGCAIDGETMQEGRTRDLIFPVAALISELSQIVTLMPGDLIFTGTPAGVGLGRDPQRFLQPGEELISWIEGVGELRQRFVD